jgi:phenylacetate-CoA ligase
MMPPLRELFHRIKVIVGLATTVSVVDSGDMPTSATGKAKRVIDNRNR